MSKTRNNISETQSGDTLRFMENETLVSNMVLADRNDDTENFIKYRAEIMYRLSISEKVLSL